jgi:hypothetical protein
MHSVSPIISRTEKLKELIGLRTRLRRLAITARQGAWHIGLPHTNPAPAESCPALSRATVMIFGMHRSGTSVIAGMLEDQGFATGAGPEHDIGGNPQGVRENQQLVRLNDEILALNRASWKVPPADRVCFTNSQLRRRNKLLVPNGPCVLKDPRTLLLSELWYHSKMSVIGVIRNPLAVSSSLRRRDPRLEHAQCLALWEAYNVRLLALLAERPFPVIEFGGAQSLDTQVTAALAFYGLRSDQPFRFFDPLAVHGTPDEREWRGAVSQRLVALWDQILRCATPTCPLVS